MMARHTNIYQQGVFRKIISISTDVDLLHDGWSPRKAKRRTQHQGKLSAQEEAPCKVKTRQHRRQFVSMGHWDWCGVDFT